MNPAGETQGALSSELIGASWCGDEREGFKYVGIGHVGEDGETVPDG